MHNLLSQQTDLDILIQEFNFWVFRSSYEPEYCAKQIIEYQDFFSLLAPVNAPSDNLPEYWQQYMTVVAESTDLTATNLNQSDDTVDFAQSFLKISQQQNALTEEYKQLLLAHQPTETSEDEWMELLQWYFELDKKETLLVHEWLNKKPYERLLERFSKNTTVVDQKILAQQLSPNFKRAVYLWGALSECALVLKKFDQKVDIAHQIFLSACWSYRRQRSKSHYMHQIKKQENNIQNLVEQGRMIVEQTRNQDTGTNQKTTMAIHGWLKILMTESSNGHLNDWTLIAAQHKKTPVSFPFNGLLIVEKIIDAHHDTKPSLNP